MKEKIKVILDTDMENEIDDQFALTYLLESLDIYDLRAITIAPFSGSKYAPTMSIKDGVNHSYDTTLKILDIMRKDYKDIVYKGSIGYMQDGYDEENDAVKAIARITKENKKIVILAIGAITNVALAINHHPEIISKIEVIWLGGNSFLYDDNDEFNFKQDIKAVRTVFDSKVKLTVIPCRNVASSLTTTIYELEHFLKGKNKIGNFLCDAFNECKPRTTGMSKTIWDLSVIGYLINQDWYRKDIISCPKIDNNGKYIQDGKRHKVTFVSDIKRNHIFEDFFTKVGKFEHTKGSIPKLKIKNIFLHLHTVNKHKWNVFKLCLKCGIPIRGLIHDLSKYSPTEFFESVRYYHGDKSPLAYSKKAQGYSAGWIHHKGRNPHHYEYWYDYAAPIQTLIMPYKCVIEMICDDLTAGKIYNGENWRDDTQYDFWTKSKYRRRIDEKTEQFVTEVFRRVGEKGINEVITKKNLQELYKFFVEGK